MTSQSATAPPVRPLYARLARRLLIALVLIVLSFIPTAVLYAITGESASTWATAAAIAGIAAVAAGGVNLGVQVAIIIGLLTPVSILAGTTPIAGAALMALMCMTVGRLSRYGLHRGALLVPIFMAWMIIDPPTWGPQHVVDRADGTYLAWMTIFFFIGTVIPVFYLPFMLRKAKLPAPVPHPRRESMPYTATITVLATVSTFVVLHNPTQYAGAWLIATILVLAQVGDVGTVQRTVARVAGTLLGMAVVSALVLYIHSLALLYVIGLAFAVVAIAAKLGPHYWLYIALVTPTVVCLNAASSSEVANLGEQRLIDTLIGAVLVLLAAALTIGYARLAQRRGHGPTVEEPRIAGSTVAP